MAIGVIGLGNIGGHIAANLVADGNDVIVHDVDVDAMAAIAGAARTLRDHARHAGAGEEPRDAAHRLDPTATRARS